jgi:DNA-binding MarR family transcriptional regulator
MKMTMHTRLTLTVINAHGSLTLPELISLTGSTLLSQYSACRKLVRAGLITSSRNPETYHRIEPTSPSAPSAS